MKRLENLPEIAQRQLGGLEATPTLLGKIKLEAAEKQSPVKSAQVLRPVLAVCCALVLCVGAVTALLPGKDAVIPQPSPNMLTNRSAGSEIIPTEAPRLLGDVPAGSISMSAGMRRSADTLFAEFGSASFPLITLNGATYRLLVSPSAISSSLLGEELGSVTEFNIEPALGSGGVVSNVVSRGEKVYAVSGMNGALAAANVEGSLRVFQRVSYAGTAIIGRETLEDTLCSADDVKWIEVSSMGRVSDSDRAQQLMETLLEYADYTGTAMSGSGSMQIGLKNGLTLQLVTGDDSVSACGSWSCPDFFEAFAEAVQ